VDEDVPEAVVPARFEDEHRRRRIGAEPIGERAAREPPPTITKS
jgi:hypothetical protein